VTAWAPGRLGAWPLVHQTGTLPTSLGGTHVVEAGAGDTVCVYLPGTNFNAAISLGIIEGLASRCQVICPDLPGQPGLSSSTRPRDEEDGYAHWVDEVLTATRDRHPRGELVLAGHSRGAAVALGATPSAVDSSVLISPAGLAGPRTGPRLLRTTVPWMLRPRTERSRALALHRRQGRSVRVLVGEHDCSFPPARVDRAAREHLGAPVQVLAGRGHLAVEEDPEQLVDRILR
jgi:pimeloyl-ACP methyl ester carboxylesterase